MLRNRFDQQWSVRKSDSTEAEQARMLNLLKPTNLNLDVRLEGSTLLVQDLMKLEPGHILNFDHALSRPITLSVNGHNKYEGHLVATRNKKSFVVEKLTING
jgi:flagellar motor switch protein FliM